MKLAASKLANKSNAWSSNVPSKETSQKKKSFSRSNLSKMKPNDESRISARSGVLDKSPRQLPQDDSKSSARYSPLSGRQSSSKVSRPSRPTSGICSTSSRLASHSEPSLLSSRTSDSKVHRISPINCISRGMDTSTDNREHQHNLTTEMIVRSANILIYRYLIIFKNF